MNDTPDAALTASSTLTEGQADLTPPGVLVWTARPDGAIAAAEDWVAALHPEDRARWNATWQAARVNGTAAAAELRLQAARGGGWRWHLVAAAPLRDAAGRVQAWHGTVVDVHQRVRAEGELRARTVALQRRTAALMEAMRAGLMRPGDLDAGLRAVTEVVARTTGVARASIWTLTPDGTALVCNDLFDARTGLHEVGAELSTGTCPEHFRALAENEVVAAEDIEADPQRAALASPGIGALLDAPILADGAFAGVVRLEHAGAARPWPETDRAFVLAIANLVALSMVQAARAQSESRLRAILESEPECVTIVSPSGVLLDINPAGLALLEAETPAALLGRTLSALVHRQDRDAFLALHRRTAAGEGGQLRYRAVGLKGTERWMETHTAPLRRSDGTIEGVLSVARDITERVRAERLRRAETEIFDLISAGAALAEVLERIARTMEETLAPGRVTVFLVDPDGMRFRHGAAPQLADFSRAVDGLPIGPAVGTCGAAIFRRSQVVSADLEADPLWQDYLPLARRHALRACWSTPALDLDGRPLASVAVYHDHLRAPTAEERDIVDRMARLVAIAIQRLRGLEALRASEATFRETFRDAAIGIAVAAPDGLIQEVNDAFARILGYAPEELRGIDLQTLTPPEDLAASRPLREDLLAGRRDSYVREKRYRTRLGGHVWVRNSVAMRRDAAGRARNVIVVTEDITPQRAAEQELRLSQALLQVASRMGQLGGWEVRLPGRETRWSDEVSRIFGLPPGEVLPMEQALAAFAPADRERLRAAFEACAADGTPWDLELEMVAANGRPVFVRSIGEAVRDGDGRIVAVHGALQDISERREAEARLRESESRFHAIAKVTADVIWDWDLRTDRVWWSEDFETAFGWPIAELPADSSAWLDRIHPEDRPRVEASRRQVIETRGSVWADEYRFLHRNGAILEIEDHGMLILGADGTPVRFVGGMRDITERKRFQRDLGERIKELRCLYRVLELTSDDSRAVEEICAEIAAFLPDSLRHGPEAVARIVIEGREHMSPGWQPPVQIVRRPIVIEAKHVGVVEIGLPAGAANGGGIAGTFLAEEHALVDAVAARLGRMIHDRRIGETLRQSDRLRAVGELTGGIAHDFNNLLTVILGNAELLAERLVGDAEGRGLALMAQSAAESAAELTRRLLAFSRRQALAPRPTDVNRLLGSMRGLLARTLGEHIEVRILGREDLWRAMIDPPQLESAILNLGINARDAMPAGGTLTIEVANVELDAAFAENTPEVEPGPYVMVAVCDTGIGMPADVLARAFDPFFTTKEVGKGSGLGLSMVWGFVKQSRGHVAIYSEPGLGTTVKLYLPRAAADVAGDAAPMRTEVLPRGRERILVVEDDALVRAHVMGQLRELGYEVVGVGDGRAALEALAGGVFDLLFTDVVMPGGMSGRDLAEEARRRLPDLKVLFTSGYTEQAMLHQGLLAPGVRLLAKPYRRQELAERVREALGRAVVPLPK